MFRRFEFPESKMCRKGSQVSSGTCVLPLECQDIFNVYHIHLILQRFSFSILCWHSSSMLYKYSKGEVCFNPE